MTSNAEPQSVGNKIAGWLQLGAIIAFIAIALLITFSMSRSAPGAPASSPDIGVPVHVITPVTQSHTINVVLNGSVTTRADVSLTPQVSGRVIEVSPSVRAGAAFEAGEVLFRVDPRDYEVAVSRARAALANARSTLMQTEAQAEVAREEWDSLYPGQPIEPLAALEPQLEAAQGGLISAQADLEDALLNLERTAFSLPFDGRILNSQIEIGTLVGAGQSYGRAFDYAGLELVAPIPPRQLARLDGAEGRDVQIIFEGGVTLTGQVARVGAGLDERTRFVDLFVSFDPGTLPIQPGLFADLTIIGPSVDPVFQLPGSATPGIGQVYTVEAGQIRSRDVTVLDRTRDAVIVTPFEFEDGVIVSSLPANSVGRDADIVSVNGERVQP